MVGIEDAQRPQVLVRATAPAKTDESVSTAGTVPSHKAYRWAGTDATPSSPQPSGPAG